MDTVSYTNIELLQRFAIILNKIQKIKDNLSKNGRIENDARFVCLSSIQRDITPLIVSIRAITIASYHMESCDKIKPQLTTLSHITGTTHEKLWEQFEVHMKTCLVVFTHFRIDCFFTNLLLAFNPTYDKKAKFTQKLTDLSKEIYSLNNEQKACFDAQTIIRNSFHNNAINMGKAFDKTINGIRFNFPTGKVITGYMFETIHLIDCTLEVLKDIIASPKVAAHNFIKDMHFLPSED